MGRKRRMKSTFINDVTVGSLWICHTNHEVIYQKTLRLVERNSYTVVLGVVPTIFSRMYVVESVIQKYGVIYSIPLEEFFLYYRKLAQP
jgi:hypothetical protein